MMQFVELLGQWGRGGDGYGGGYGPGGMMGGGWYGMGWFGGIFMIIFWILIIVGIVVLIKWVSTMSKGTPVQGGGQQEDSAIEILRRRYAKGDITKEEFEEKKKDLS